MRAWAWPCSQCLGGELAWVADNDPGAARILAHHYPDVPNLGDITAVDWAAVTLVNILIGGYPCQPFSDAGLRKGTTDERHIWPYYRRRHSRTTTPHSIVLENVRGPPWTGTRCCPRRPCRPRVQCGVGHYAGGWSWGPATSASEYSSSRGLLKTPTAQLAVNGGSQDPEKRKAGGHGPTLADQVEHQLLRRPALTTTARHRKLTWP